MQLNINWQDFATGVAVGGAVVYLIYRGIKNIRRKKGCSCSDGCSYYNNGSCNCPDRSEKENKGKPR